MLTSLHIENFIIVKQLELDFSNGMTAFTGETGAGKSIMIDALLLVLGGRADSSVIRAGEEKCDITACFLVENQPELSQWIEEHDINFENKEIILRRVIYNEGRSKSYINGQPTPLQLIKELSSLLVHIHGQHQHQALLQPSTHRQQLDTYANHHDLVNQVNSLYKQCHQIKLEIDTLIGKASQKQAITELELQIEELTTLNLQEGEMAALHEEHQRLHYGCDYLNYIQQINLLLNTHEEANVCQRLNQILQLLLKLPQEQEAIKSTTELINSALIQCEEALNEIDRFAEHVQIDPERLRDVEARMSELHFIGRKYHIEASKLPSYLLKLETELTQLLTTENELTQLKQSYQYALQLFNTAAEKLRESRQYHAQKLATEITTFIHKLGMPKGRIEIQMTPLEKMQSHGLDHVEYKVCTNPGTELDALTKIASGGELSRISLAIQVITAHKATSPTLLFDEVDVGIGGTTAALVGQLLRSLGDRLQVFCVTHQPQVAAAAHHHFVVEKLSDHQQTFSRVIKLTTHEKIEEIARMLGGLRITQQTRSHAKELLMQTEEF